jgi:hypothetical protein
MRAIGIAVIIVALSTMTTARAQFDDGGVHNITTPITGTGGQIAAVRVSNGTTVNILPGGIVTGVGQQDGIFADGTGTQINVAGGTVRGASHPDLDSSLGVGIVAASGAYVTVGPGSLVRGGDSIGPEFAFGGVGVLANSGSRFTGGTIRGGDSDDGTGGEGVRLQGATLHEIRGGEFQGGDGGGNGVQANAARLTVITGGTFTGGAARSSSVFGGEGLASFGGEVQILGGVFTGGATMEGVGSAALFAGANSLSIEGGSFTGGMGPGGLGASVLFGGDAGISGGDFSGAFDFRFLREGAVVTVNGRGDQLAVVGDGSSWQLVGTLFNDNSIEVALLAPLSEQLQFFSETIDIGVPGVPLELTRISIRLASVPEPSSLALLGVGAAGLALAARRRRRASV